MSERRDDEALFGKLGPAVARHDPVPEAVSAAARGAFGMASLEAELATLVYDSSLGDEDTRALVRGQGGGRELTFEAPSLTVEVEVLTAERRLLGQPQPRGLGDVGGVGPAEPLAPGDGPDQPGVAIDKRIPRIGISGRRPSNGALHIKVRHQKKSYASCISERVRRSCT